MTSSESSPRRGWLSNLRSWHGWRSLAVSVVLLLVGVAAVLLYHRPTPPDPPLPPADMKARFARLPVAPSPEPPAPAGVRLHSVTVAEEEGKRVIKIRATPGGEELVVDAATGKLLAVRERRRPVGANQPGNEMGLAWPLSDT